MIPRTKEKPKREDYKFYDAYARANQLWKKSAPKAGSTKTTRKRKGSKWITTTQVWNGSKWVDKGDKSLVPSRAGKNDGNTKENNKLKIKAQQEKDAKIPKVKYNNGSGNGSGNESDGSKKTKGVGPVKDGAKYAKNLKNTTQGIGPVKDGETYAKNATPYKKVTKEELKAKMAEGKKPKVVEKKKPKKLIKHKGKFVSSRSVKGKQLLKIAERKRKLKEKRFGKK